MSGSKSIWKLQYLNQFLENNIYQQNLKSNNFNKDKIYLFDRAAVISPIAINNNIYVYNGLKFINVYIKTKEFVNFKYGSFSLTRKIGKQQKSKKKNK